MLHHSNDSYVPYVDVLMHMLMHCHLPSAFDSLHKLD